MKQKTIAELKTLLKSNKLTDEMIRTLKNDQRKGVQKLLESFEKRQARVLESEKAFYKMGHYERTCYEAGDTYVAGVDEAGRGPLAGPVVAAAVILPQSFQLLGLTDSKQLTADQRMTYFEIIKEQAVSYGIGIVHNEDIDRLNILEATKRAMEEAIDTLSPAPETVLIDAVTLEHPKYDCQSIIKGDEKSISIAAASVLAKVTRDRLMDQIHEAYPMYHFQSNKGYGTKEHIQMLQKYGPSPYHRQTFAPIKQLKLF